MGCEFGSDRINLTGDITVFVHFESAAGLWAVDRGIQTPARLHSGGPYRETSVGEI